MTVKLVFISLKDTGEEKDMCLKSEDIMVIAGSNLNYLNKTISNSPLSEYQSNLFEKMKGSDFNFDNFNNKYDSCHKTILKRSISHIEYPDWLKNNKQIITRKNKDEECFNIQS